MLATLFKPSNNYKYDDTRAITQWLLGPNLKTQIAHDHARLPLEKQHTPQEHTFIYLYLQHFTMA